MTFCGDTDEYDDCDFPDSDDLPVGFEHVCPRCGRPWKLVDMFDCKLWQSVTVHDADGNVVDPERESGRELDESDVFGNDRCDPANGYHSTPHRGCILR